MSSVLFFTYIIIKYVQVDVSFTNNNRVIKLEIHIIIKILNNVRLWNEYLKVRLIKEVMI